MNTRSTAGTTSRVHYIDNLRWITISLLVLYHACMAYNTWGEKNYIFFKDLKPLAFVVVLISPWFMPLMFLLAGVSASYSRSKRGYGHFIAERFKRLGIPLVIGLIINTPILSYIADITHNHYQGNFIQHYVIFYSRFTDLSGYDGGFALGHLWFLLVLLVISLLSCLVIRMLPRKKTVPLSVNSTASVYDFQFVPSRLYSFFSLSALNVAETSTSPFVASVTSADADGFSGIATVKFRTSNGVASERLPAASEQRKYTMPLNVNGTAPSYACQFMPSKLYSFTAASSGKTAETFTVPSVSPVVCTSEAADGAFGATLSMLSTV